MWALPRCSRQYGEVEGNFAPEDFNLREKGKVAIKGLQLFQNAL